MDEFVLSIDREKFRSTNAAWNNLMLNDPWSVGYVSQLIETKRWTSKEEWEQFYYDSGAIRKSLLGSESDVLDNDTLQLNEKSVIKDLPWELKNLNYQYGRTKDDLMAKANRLHGAVSSLTIEECFECVRFRTICETWNGIFVREQNTIKTLSSMFPKLSFKKTDGETDHTYAVDYEVYYLGVLKFGIQIKPISYSYNTPYLKKAKYANQQKYAAYFKEKGVSVIVILAKSDGAIQDTQAIDMLRRIEVG